MLNNQLCVSLWSFAVLLQIWLSAHQPNFCRAFVGNNKKVYGHVL